MALAVALAACNSTLGESESSPPVESSKNRFRAFVKETEPRLRHALVAAFGQDRGREATAATTLPDIQEEGKLTGETSLGTWEWVRDDEGLPGDGFIEGPGFSNPDEVPIPPKVLRLVGGEFTESESDFDFFPLGSNLGANVAGPGCRLADDGVYVEFEHLIEGSDTVQDGESYPDFYYTSWVGGFVGLEQ